MADATTTTTPEKPDAQEQRPANDPLRAEPPGGIETPPDDDIDLDEDDDDEGVDKDKSTKPDDKVVDSSARIQALERDLALIRTDKDMLAQRVLELSKQQAKPADTDPDAEPTDEELLELLKTNPVGAIKKIASLTAGRAGSEAKEHATNQQLLAAERTQTMQEFPDLATNQELYNTTAAILQSLMDTYGGGEVMPGMINEAATLAWAKLSRAGKLQPAAPANGNGARRNARQIVGRPPAMPMTGSPDGEDDEDSELDLTAEELAGIKQSCKEWGIPVKNYLATYKKLRKEDALYGR